MKNSDISNLTTRQNHTNRPATRTRPHVRYGYPPGAEKPTQLPNLHTLSAGVPESATTVSPVYLLTDNEAEQVDHKENPYAVSGESCLATKLQNRAEEAGAIRYPVHAESDDYPDTPLPEMVDEMGVFVEKELDCLAEEIEFYYSGNRSVHAHVPRFVGTYDDLQTLKQRAERFCEETGATFDTGIYSKKRQFRLPGVKHQKSGLTKVKVAKDWSHQQIISKSNSGRPRPESYQDFLLKVFSDKSSGNVCAEEFGARPWGITGGSSSVISFGKETPLVEQRAAPEEDRKIWKWCQYNTHPFSPYANADGERSVAVVEVKGGAFVRKDIKKGNSQEPVHALVPAFFFGATGCDGDFTKEAQHAPLQLSPQDFEKRQYSTGDLLIIIGGQSRSSRIFDVTRGEAEDVGELVGESPDREDALAYLEDSGYNTGAAGGQWSSSDNKDSGTSKKR